MQVNVIVHNNVLNKVLFNLEDIKNSHLNITLHRRQKANGNDNINTILTREGSPSCPIECRWKAMEIKEISTTSTRPNATGEEL